MLALMAGHGLRDVLGGEVAVMVRLQDVSWDRGSVISGRRSGSGGWSCWLVHKSSVRQIQRVARGRWSKRLPERGGVVAAVLPVALRPANRGIGLGWL